MDTIAYDELFFYKLDNHDDIHLRVGERLKQFPYSPETFREIFLECRSKCKDKTLSSVCYSLPFSIEMNKAIYKEELETEIDESIARKDVSASIDTKIIRPDYLSGEEAATILKTKEIPFKCILEPDDYSRNSSVINDSFDIFAFEKDLFSNTVGELRTLRNEAIKRQKESSEENKFFFGIGASIIGPVYALYAEWIIRFCKDNNITRLLPMMREATVLKKCLDELGHISSSPLYCSRRALFNASITEENFADKTTQILIKTKASPTVLCNDIGLSNTAFCSYNTFNTLSDLYRDGRREEFVDFLMSKKSQILNYSRMQRKYFCKMLLEIARGEKVATVDIGFSGTSEGLIRDIIAEEKIDLDISHLILMGADGAQIQNILSGLKIFSWLGMAGENTDNTKRLMYQIQVIEPLINDICGTTLKYNNRGAIIDNEFPPELSSNDTKALACQRGVASFVSIWKAYREYYDIDSLLCNKVGFINMWRRLIEAPNVQEAKMLGELLLFDNYTLDKKVYKVRDDAKIEAGMLDNYIDNISRSKSDYPQANVVLQYPYYFKEQLIINREKIPGIRRIFTILDDLRGKEHIAIFAAGQRGRDILKVAKLLDVSIECFIDSDKRLQGQTIGGVPVVSLEKAGNIRYFINASYNYPDEVQELLLGNYEDPVIYGFE